jgi:uncharacterized protein (DUF433 family)
METVKSPAIRLDDAGVAWIHGTTTKVIEVVLNKLGSESSLEELEKDLPHLSPAQIAAALDYYHAHQLELDAEIQRRRLLVEEMRAQERNPLVRSELLARKQRLG